MRQASSSSLKSRSTEWAAAHEEDKAERSVFPKEIPREASAGLAGVPQLQVGQPIGGTNHSACCSQRSVELQEIDMPAIIMWLLGVPLIVIVLLYLVF